MQERQKAAYQKNKEYIWKIFGSCKSAEERIKAADEIEKLLRKYKGFVIQARGGKSVDEGGA